MANSGDKLTKYKSAVTIITADAANTWYGGLYGSAEGAGLAATNPLIGGHVHDGQHLDGHAQKIDLVNHVTNKLKNSNIETAAINKRTVSKLINQGDAIPEYEIVDGNPYYYLDLSEIRDDLGSFEYYSTDDVIRQTEDSGGTYAATDFLFGATTLDYDSSNAARFYFDKSKAAFRAGWSTGTNWNESNVGDYSAAFGRNTQASADSSFVVGQLNSISSSSDYSSILGGLSNSIASTSVSAEYTVIVGGYDSSIESSPYSFIGGGKGHLITTSDPTSQSSYNVIVGGGGAGGSSYNYIEGTGSIASFIGAGSDNRINVAKDSGTNGLTDAAAPTAVQTRHVIVGGKSNTIGAVTNFGEFGLIGTGLSNAILSSNTSWSGCTILNGIDNEIDGARFNQILNGYSNIISGSSSFRNNIFNGGNNEITSSVNSSILSGESNTVTNSHVTVLSSSSVTGNSYGAIYHGSSNGDTNHVANLVFSGNVANATTNYYIFLNGLNNQISITAVGAERFKISYGGAGVTEGTGVTFVGEYTCVGDVSTVKTIYGGRISRAAYVTTGGVLTWSPAGATSHLSITTADFVGGLGGTLEYVNTSNEVAIRVNMPANHTNFSWTFAVRAIFAKT